MGFFRSKKYREKPNLLNLFKLKLQMKKKTIKKNGRKSLSELKQIAKINQLFYFEKNSENYEQNMNKKFLLVICHLIAPKPPKPESLA